MKPQTLPPTLTRLLTLGSTALLLMGTTSIHAQTQFKLQAPGKTVVKLHEPLTFTVSTGYFANSRSSTISPDAEPGPTFSGTQTWFVGGTEGFGERVERFHYGYSTTEGWTSHAIHGLSAPASGWVSDEYSFEVTFSTLGQHQVAISAMLDLERQTWRRTSELQRTCWAFWVCSDWEQGRVWSEHRSEKGQVGLGWAAFNVTVVPEPQSGTLLGLGLVAVLGTASRRIGNSTA